MSRLNDTAQVRARGIALFNEARYFESHEAFEELWLAAKGPDRALYQGLVQACAGLLKQQRGQNAAASTLLTKSLANLGRAEGHGWSALDHAALVAQLTSIRSALERGETSEPPGIDLGPVT